MVHVKYPSMERQDLTRGQLGAFKFTPVGENVRQSPQPHQHALLMQQCTRSPQNDGGSIHSWTSPDFAADCPLLNHQIKPSLDSSRGRLDPAAAHSPQKRLDQPIESFMRPSAQVFHPQYHGSSENDSLPSMYTSEANSIPMSDGSLQTFSHANTSLLRALEAEQEAHKVTKVHLDHVLHAHRRAEAENQQLTEHNKALLSSIKLLQSTVKHMVRKESGSKSEADVTTAVRKPNNQRESATPPDSILYDIFKNYKMLKNTEQPDEETACVENRDLFNAPEESDTSEKAELQQSLKNQMGVLTDGEVNNAIGTEYTRKIEEIVQNGPQYTTRANKQEEQTNQQSASNAAVSHDKGTDTADPQTQSLAQPDRISSFVYDLPESFLRKYGKKPAEVSTNLSETPRGGNLTASSVCISKFPESNADRPSRVIYMPDSTIINWKIDCRQVVELRGGHFQTHGGSHFRDYPIRYVPPMSDRNIFRTVMIDFIPYGTPYCDVLAQVRGGTLESIQLYGPIGDATDFATARIIYTEEEGANALYKQGQDPGVYINGCQVRVWQVMEPTYPKNKELQEAIYTHGHTRILIINAPQLVMVEQVLKRKLRKQIEAGLILDISKSHDGIPIVEFTSIEDSTKALQRFLNDREFAGADFDFDNDPCAASYS